MVPHLIAKKLLSSKFKLEILGDGRIELVKFLVQIVKLGKSPRGHPLTLFSVGTDVPHLEIISTSTTVSVYVCMWWRDKGYVHLWQMLLRAGDRTSIYANGEVKKDI